MLRATLEIYCDGGARGNPGPAACAFVAIKNGQVVFKVAKFLGVTTNNIAEYNAVLLAFTWLANNIDDSLKNIQVILDSELVSRQLSEKYRVKNKGLRNIFEKIKKMEKAFSIPIFYSCVPRNKNKLADFLVNKTLDEKF